MIPVTLQITNFRSFTKTQVFHFPEKPGLYFLYGDNQVEPRLEGNGAGKSSVWDALYWLFFNKTARGLKAGDMANWGIGKGTEVQLEFRTPDKALPQYIKRTWSPNTWTMFDLFGNVTDLTKGETNPVLEMLRLEAEPFLASVLMAQGQPMFLDLERGAQAALFAKVMGLDRWLAYSEAASSEASTLEPRVRALEDDVTRGRANLEAVNTGYLQQQLDEWEESRKKRLSSLESEYRGLIARQDSLKVKRGQTEEDVERLRLAYRDALVDSEAAYDHVTAVKKEHLNLEDMKDKCPTCGQSINNHLSEALRAATAASDEAKRCLRAWDAEQAAVRQIQRDIESIDKALDSLEAREDQIVEEQNPFARMLATATEHRAELEAVLDGAMHRLDALSERLSVLKGWQRWFKEIRLQQIATALDHLEVEVNSCVNALGLTNWELRFDVDKETAKGTLQRGFTVTVISPHNARPVPWEAWSGGESQRLRVAAQLGLSNLIRARTGADIPLEVWDEPTQWMTAQGVSDLLESLKARALAEKRQIWVVDHRTLGYADFDGVVGVVKTAAGSSFVSGYVSDHARRPDAPDAGRRTVHDVVRRRPTR